MIEFKANMDPSDTESNNLCIDETRAGDNTSANANAKPKTAITKRELLLAFVAVTTIVIFAIAAVQSKQNRTRKPILKARMSTSSSSSSSTFKIVQIADIHLGEAEDQDWGPEQDRKTWHVLEQTINAEQPDLIVLSGDQLTANNCKNNATEYYKLLGNHLMQYKTPWALIFGNHDDTDYEDESTGTTYPAKYKRNDLLAIDQSFSYSLTQGSNNIFGTSNYVLNIMSSNNNVLSQIYFLDSGGGSLSKEIQQNQIDWFVEENILKKPIIVFQHIPTDEFLYNSQDDNMCTGTKGESGGIEGLDYDAGIVSALIQMENVHFLAVGHQHGNDYCCKLSDTTMQVCFARHSGYGGYGTWERGARVYELKFHHADETSMTWKSWVRLESGEVINVVESD